MNNTVQKNRRGIFRILNSFWLMSLITILILGADIASAQSSSVDLSGPSDYINLGTALTTATNFTTSSVFTMEAWVKLNSVAGFNVIFANRPSGSYERGYIFTLVDGKPYFEGYATGSMAPTAIVSNVWTHIAVVFNNGTCSFYVNGALVHSSSGVNVSSRTSTSALIGTMTNGWAGFNGSIDEFRIWNVARTQSEIADNMGHNSLCGTTGLVAYFPFDENTGTTTSSNVGGYVGTLLNGATWAPGVNGTPCLPTQTLTILGGNGNPGDVDPYTEASRDGGLTWQRAYLTGPGHPWGNVTGTNSWINFTPSYYSGIGGYTDFRIRFNIPAEFFNPKMTFTIKADNRAWLSINGTNISYIIGQPLPTADLSIAQHLHPGLNEIIIKLKDDGGSPPGNYVGLNYRIDITMESNEEPSLEPSRFVNTAPVAVAGEDQTIDCALSAGAEVTLDGSGSTDADNDPLTYSWSNGANTASQTLTLTPGEYTFTLTVNDGKGGSSTDDVKISIVEDLTAPVLTIPSDTTLIIGVNTTAVYTGPSATAVDECDPEPTVTSNPELPHTFTSAGVYTITYTATDANGNSSTADQTITVGATTMLTKALTIPALQALTPLNKKVDKKIEKAIEEIQKSLNPELWKDEYHLVAKKGEKVFKEEKDAVNQLMTFIKKDYKEDDDDHDDHDKGKDKDHNKYSVDSATAAAVMNVIFTLVDVDKSLATLAIAEAQVIFTDSKGLKKIDEANKKMQDAQKKFDDGKYAQAIDKYKDAWKAVSEKEDKSHNTANTESQETVVVTESVPTEFSLNQNYPNPFNPSTIIKFGLPESGLYTLKVYNTLGQEVAELVNGQMGAGNYSISFDASRLSTGVYIYSIRGNNVNISKKMILMK